VHAHVIVCAQYQASKPFRISAWFWQPSSKRDLPSSLATEHISALTMCAAAAVPSPLKPAVHHYTQIFHKPFIIYQLIKMLFLNKCKTGTCEASRFNSNFNRTSDRPIRFNSKVIGWFKNFRIESAVPAPLLVVSLVKRLKPLMPLSGTVYRLASSMTGPYSAFEKWSGRV